MTEVAAGADLGRDVGLVAVVTRGTGPARGLRVEQIVRPQGAGCTGVVAEVRLVGAGPAGGGVAALADTEVSGRALSAASAGGAVAVAAVEIKAGVAGAARVSGGCARGLGRGTRRRLGSRISRLRRGLRAGL